MIVLRIIYCIPSGLYSIQQQEFKSKQNKQIPYFFLYFFFFVVLRFIMELEVQKSNTYHLFLIINVFNYFLFRFVSLWNSIKYAIFSDFAFNNLNKLKIKYVLQQRNKIKTSTTQ